MKRIHIVALIAGLAADLIGSIIVSAAVTFVFIAVRGAGQPSQAIIETLETDPLFLSIGFIIGIAFTLLGAYIVARMSRPHSVLNTLVFGIISTLLGLFFVSTYPLWYTILCVLTIIPISLAPGYLLADEKV